MASLTGIMACVLRKLGIPLVPILIAFVLRRLFKDNLRRALSLSRGDAAILFSSSVTLIFRVLTALLLPLPWLMPRLRARMQAVSGEG